MDSDTRGEVLSGRPLRYLLTITLFQRGPLTVAELTATIEREGFALKGRPSKAISDALRWEIEHGRAIRLGRGRYGPGTIPRQTRSWIGQRVERLRARGRGLAELSLGSPDNPNRQRHSDSPAHPGQLSL